MSSFHLHLQVHALYARIVVNAQAFDDVTLQMKLLQMRNKMNGFEYDSMEQFVLDMNVVLLYVYQPNNIPQHVEKNVAAKLNYFGYDRDGKCRGSTGKCENGNVEKYTKNDSVGGIEMNLPSCLSQIPAKTDHSSQSYATIGASEDKSSAKEDKSSANNDNTSAKDENTSAKDENTSTKDDNTSTKDDKTSANAVENQSMGRKRRSARNKPSEELKDAKPSTRSSRRIARSGENAADKDKQLPSPENVLTAEAMALKNTIDSTIVEENADNSIEATIAEENADNTLDSTIVEENADNSGHLNGVHDSAEKKMMDKEATYGVKLEGIVFEFEKKYVPRVQRRGNGYGGVLKFGEGYFDVPGVFQTKEEASIGYEAYLQTFNDSKDAMNTIIEMEVDQVTSTKQRMSVAVEDALDVLGIVNLDEFVAFPKDVYREEESDEEDDQEMAQPAKKRRKKFGVKRKVKSKSQRVMNKIAKVKLCKHIQAGNSIGIEDDMSIGTIQADGSILHIESNLTMSPNSFYRKIDPVSRMTDAYKKFLTTPAIAPLSLRQHYQNCERISMGITSNERPVRQRRASGIISKLNPWLEDIRIGQDVLYRGTDKALWRMQLIKSDASNLYLSYYPDKLHTLYIGSNLIADSDEDENSFSTKYTIPLLKVSIESNKLHSATVGATKETIWQATVICIHCHKPETNKYDLAHCNSRKCEVSCHIPCLAKMNDNQPVDKLNWQCPRHKAQPVQSHIIQN